MKTKKARASSWAPRDWA